MNLASCRPQIKLKWWTCNFSVDMQYIVVYLVIFNKKKETLLCNIKFIYLFFFFSALSAHFTYKKILKTMTLNTIRVS